MPVGVTKEERKDVVRSYVRDIFEETDAIKFTPDDWMEEWVVDALDEVGDLEHEINRESVEVAIRELLSESMARAHQNDLI